MRLRQAMLPQSLALVSYVLVFFISSTAWAAGPDTTRSHDELPLSTEHVISFVTNEGSWMSLDVRPDGNQIVFDLLGDLYTMPADGGEAQQLTRGMAFDSQPRYSPDGSAIAFVSDRSGSENIWLYDLEDEEASPLTDTDNHLYQSPNWTPDGRYVIASRGVGLGASQLYIYHVDGGSGTQLGEVPDNTQMLGAEFGDNNRFVWYAQRSGSWDYNAQFPQYQLFVYDRETGERHRRSNRFGSAFRPTVSSDGQWLVYGTRHEDETGLRIRDLNTGDERWLAYPIQHDDQESRATRDVLPGMAFTPDSEHLVVSYGGSFWRLPVEGGDDQALSFTAEIELETGPQLDVQFPVDDSPTFRAQQIRDPQRSPDGDRLAFSALNQIYVMDFPDGVPTPLAEDQDVNQHQPVWSPDGSSIAYVSWDDRAGHIFRMDAEPGASPEQLTEQAAFYRELAWSPDGDRLVTVRSSARELIEEAGGTGTDLVWLSAEGGAVTEVMPFSGYSTPHFSQNPERIFAHSSSDGLVSFRWDGTDRREHLQVTGQPQPGADTPPTASSILVSGDVQQAIAQVNNDLYLVTIPVVGGDAPTVSVANPDAAAFPVTRLTDVGGQFPHWGPDGDMVHWSIGPAYFSFDIAEAQAYEVESNGTQNDDENEDEDPGYQPEERLIEIQAQRDLPEGEILLQGATIITMQGDEVIDQGDVLIDGHRIAGVGPSGQLDASDDAEIVDVSGHYIVPGFVDTHAHLRPPRGVHKAQVWAYLANLAYGVTTTRDPQTGTTDVLTYADLVETGDLIGPRIYSTGPGVFRGENIRDLDHAQDILRRYSEYYDTKTIKMYVAGTREQRQWILEAARDQDLIPTTEGALDLKLNLTQIIDGYPAQEHNFPIFPLYGDIMEVMLEKNVAYTPTLLVTYGGPWGENYYFTTEDAHTDPKLNRFTPYRELAQRTTQRNWFHESRFNFDRHARFVADLVAQGGTAGVGSHGQLQGLGYHWELWAMASGGMDPHDALHAATRLGAESIGHGADLGIVEPGKLADLVILRQNPLADLRHTNTIQYVMKNGRLYDADTLDQLYPENVPLPSLTWEDEHPSNVPGMEMD